MYEAPCWATFETKDLHSRITLLQQEIVVLDEERSHCPDERNLMQWDKRYGWNIVRCQEEINTICAELLSRSKQ